MHAAPHVEEHDGSESPLSQDYHDHMHALSGEHMHAAPHVEEYVHTGQMHADQDSDDPWEDDDYDPGKAIRVEAGCYECQSCLYSGPHPESQRCPRCREIWM